MFTGIASRKRAAWRPSLPDPTAGGWRSTDRWCRPTRSFGDSIAVNGCCLTVAGIEGSRLRFRRNVLEETRQADRGFSGTPVGGQLNLERSP